MPKVLVIDNYDSFVYNLVQYFAELGAETIVWRNDEYPIDQVVNEVAKVKPSHILISPGPGKPKDSGISLEIIREFKGKIPILGVCLGMQAMGELHGAKVVHAPELMHGKTSEITHMGTHAIFKDIPETFIATRYHSLVVDRASLDAAPQLVLEAEVDGIVMALSHRDYPSLIGVQYHPESILSEYGHKLLSNFLEIA
ncbi:MAG: aminodeoxychorismate/anthranilate synthase component II [Cyanobacteria bacterium]|nr:aminodeoxychorismate/anthranilate synthase component II [Cyanobacteriota bacterium]MDA1020686.1 aminodeoxychorismate/anthranilate synthase component II [Cyanobacteriota bacterium]